MTDKHSMSFFGQQSAIIINSVYNSMDTFIRHIKKKSDGTWEKPSAGEGKSIKLNLKEIIGMSEVLRKEVRDWSTVHSFKENKTTINLSWEDETAQKLWVNIDDRVKLIRKEEAEILKLLFEHFIKEKIEFATVSTPQET